MDKQDALIEEKKFYERFWALHNNSDLVEVYKKFGIAAFRRSSVLEDFEFFVKESGFSGKTCVEIGTFRGLTTVVLSKYFEKVISLDIIEEPVKYEIVDHLGIKNIEFVNIRDNKEKADILESVDFDAAYVDGNHKKDTETDFNLVKKCGKVLFHEYWEPQPAVKKLVDSLSNVRICGKLALWTA